ncbi:serine/threonine-protein kinase ATG1c-like isoform X2 [Cynara cardunculus var. scolymus]|uniref:serine/threonine-protein kinase ATG1c-like isoform X2 n=1 Tax=Cynara cardunculus var. scolymus TaxID=59895 RepID=UPI000D628E95|nr:serine/threonine-protein kinase ATG1c-like isoform X2 [Cynara cardunculus var. scolymus]
MMAQSSYRVRSVGDYVVGKQLGSGSFSVVWHARHKIHGTEVAIKEILTGKLNKKLEESLMSEIDILRNVNHPNIIRLHEMIKEPGKIHLVLEYCKGGDLSMFIQRRQGRIPKSTAVHFMQQLAAGLKVLRENQIIHRDLKPQNLLLSTNDDNSTLKIADFGFARSLQPRGLAETLCGSPLYMAPEIMQLHKYDAKADLWSVGAILFQLVTGRTPFTGNNQIQLLQNIMKSTELQFPPDVKDLSYECIDLCRKLLRQNPVERLTFEEFFTHPYLTQTQPDELSRDRRPRRTMDGFSYPKIPAFRNKQENCQEDNLPFSLDDDSNDPDGSPSYVRRSPLRSTYGFSLDTEVDRRDLSKDMEISSRYSSIRQKPDNNGFVPGNRRPSEGNLKESLRSIEHRPVNMHSKVDALELIDQDYVIVSGPLGDASSLASVSKVIQSASKTGSPPLPLRDIHSTSSAPLPIIGGAASKMRCTGSFESQCSAPSGTSHGSVDIIDVSEQPPTDCMARIKSLHDCASAISELVNDKIEAGRRLEAFSIQLVILAIWKQALDICHTQAASAIKGSPCQETTTFNMTSNRERDGPDIQECLETAKSPQDVCSHIERIFLGEVENAEELAKVIEPGNDGMPDAMEIIFQAALNFGKHGAVDEYMGFVENAAGFYSKAVRLLSFLLVEAPSLILNPPFSITNSDRYRLRTYIDLLNNRQSHSRSQRIALLKGVGYQHSPA